MSSELKIRLDPEKFKEAGVSLIFHVDVLDRDGCVCASENIPIRSEFYRSLKDSEAWPDCFFKIIRTRVLDRLNEKRSPKKLGIDEVLDLSNKIIEL